jgi:hypothetical protein
MCLIFVVVTSYLHAGELLGVPLFDCYDFRVLSFFFKLILTQRPGYLFADIFGLLSLFFISLFGSFVLVRGIHLWNQLPFAIKNVRSVTAFERAVLLFFHLSFTLFGLDLRIVTYENLRIIYVVINLFVLLTMFDIIIKYLKI